MESILHAHTLSPFPLPATLEWLPPLFLSHLSKRSLNGSTAVPSGSTAGPSGGTAGTGGSTASPSSSTASAGGSTVVLAVVPLLVSGSTAPGA